MTRTLPQEDRVGGDGGNDVIPASNPTDGPIVMELFLDVENLQRSMTDKGVLRPDWQDLAWHIAGRTAQTLSLRLVGTDDHGDEGKMGGKIAVQRGAVWAFASWPKNGHPRDEFVVQRNVGELERLRGLNGFCLQAWPRDLHGVPMSQHSDPESRREKYVDGAVSTLLTKRCLSGDPPAVVVVASGDADFIPALKTIRQDRPDIQIVVAAFSEALASDYRSGARVGVEWQHHPLILDDWLEQFNESSHEPAASRQASPSQEEGYSPMIKQPRHEDIVHEMRETHPQRQARDLQLGRMVVTRPLFGQLEVYKKSDGRLGAIVICEEDGGRYGVVLGILQRFQEMGIYAGWSYADPLRKQVFRFVAGQADMAPECLLAIEAADGRIGVPRAVASGLRPQPGSWVAFYYRQALGRGEARPRREATHVFPLDSSHVPLIARLIAEGRLVFPDHADVFGVFLDALPGLGAARNADGLLDAALARVVSDPGTPPDYRMLARVERSKMISSDGDEAGAPVPRDCSSPGGKPRSASAAKQISDSVVKPTATGDVVQMKLQLD